MSEREIFYSDVHVGGRARASVLMSVCVHKSCRASHFSSGNPIIVPSLAQLAHPFARMPPLLAPLSIICRFMACLSPLSPSSLFFSTAACSYFVLYRCLQAVKEIWLATLSFDIAPDLVTEDDKNLEVNNAQLHSISTLPTFGNDSCIMRR